MSVYWVAWVEASTIDDIPDYPIGARDTYEELCSFIAQFRRATGCTGVIRTAKAEREEET